jgi:hypothetical protein
MHQSGRDRLGPVHPVCSNRRGGRHSLLRRRGLSPSLQQQTWRRAFVAAKKGIITQSAATDVAEGIRCCEDGVNPGCAGPGPGSEQVFLPEETGTGAKAAGHRRSKAARRPPSSGWRRPLRLERFIDAPKEKGPGRGKSVAGQARGRARRPPPQPSAGTASAR